MVLVATVPELRVRLRNHATVTSDPATPSTRGGALQRWVRCPSCASTLGRDNSTFGCEHGHRFDLAKEGYLNLLLAQARKSHDPGYSKAMIASRHAFFSRGHYEQLADTIAEIVASYVTPSGSAVNAARVLDAGCGEGYYMRRIRNWWEQQHLAIDLCGIDISKHGIKLASKRDPQSAYAVASSHDLPLPDTCADVIFTHFSPVFADSFRRVARPNAVVLVGSPGPMHLFGLKALVYERPAPHEETHALANHVGFELIGTHRINYRLDLRDNASITDLLAMTPFYWSASEETQAALAMRTELATDIDVNVDAYRVTAP